MFILGPTIFHCSTICVGALFIVIRPQHLNSYFGSDKHNKVSKLLWYSLIFHLFKSTPITVQACLKDHYSALLFPRICLLVYTIKIVVRTTLVFVDEPSIIFHSLI